MSPGLPPALRRSPSGTLKRAIERSKGCEPPMRVVALPQGARVESVVDLDAAPQAFADGVKPAETLPPSGRHLQPGVAAQRCPGGQQQLDTAGAALQFRDWREHFRSGDLDGGERCWAGGQPSDAVIPAAEFFGEAIEMLRQPHRLPVRPGMAQTASRMPSRTTHISSWRHTVLSV